MRQVSTRVRPRASIGRYSVIHPSVKLGMSVKVWNMVYIGEGTTVGDGTMIGSLSHIDEQVVIGKSCRIQGMVYISAKCKIGDRVFMGPGSALLNDKYPPKMKSLEPAVIEDRVVIGGNVTLLPGVTIGEEAKIGAGSVVTQNIPSGKIYFGNPAREYKDMTKWNHEK